jgi:aminopeptidase
MQTSPISPTKTARQFPAFDLTRLLQTIFQPHKGEKLCILIDLKNPADVVNYKFLKNPELPVQKKAYEVFYQGIQRGVMQQLQLGACDFFAYQETGGSNLDLPNTVMSPEGNVITLKEICTTYNIILCITSFSATAPLTALGKQFGFRGATMHGVNDIILKTGLAVDYNEVSRQTENLRLGMTHADSVEIDFAVENKNYSLKIDLGRQNAQKSHGICHNSPDVVNLPAGEVYFVPFNASGSFPMKFEDGTLGLMHVENGKVNNVTLIKGNQSVINELQAKFDSDPAAGTIGELGFGTQELPYAASDIQDEKIFGTFHLATGRNDHLYGSVTPDLFNNKRNATHDDILFSSTKTPEIQVKQVRMNRHGKTIVLIENYEPSLYLKNLL